MNREPIWQALFTRLSAAAPFVTTSRRLCHWSDVPAIEQPALFVAQGGEQASTTTGQPTRWELEGQVYVYARVDDGAVPGTVMNPLMDAITAVLAPANPMQRQTLGGLVEWVRIDGRIETDEGVLGDQAVAIIPIRILVPA